MRTFITIVSFESVLVRPLLLVIFILHILRIRLTIIISLFIVAVRCFRNIQHTLFLTHKNTYIALSLYLRGLLVSM